MDWPSAPWGGALISKELSSYSGVLDSDSQNRESQLNKENERIIEEQKTSEFKFKELNDKNEETRGKSKSRRSAGDSLQSENYKLDSERRSQHFKLNAQKTTLENSLKTTLETFKTGIEGKVQTLRTEVKKIVDEETDKLSKALDNLKESNKQLIQRVKECIENMPYEIFKEKEEDRKCKSPVAEGKS